MAKEIYMLKLGGSVITETNKVDKARSNEIRRLLLEIRSGMRAKGFALVLGNGAGSAHVIAKKYRVHEGLLRKDSMFGALKTQSSVRRLNDFIVNTGLGVGLYLLPFSPSSFISKRDRRVVEGFASHIIEGLRLGFIPSVYGDVVIDLKQGVAIASTEEVFAFLAPKIMPSKIILGTDVDGVFDSDPTKNRDAKLIERIDSGNIKEIVEKTGGAHKIDVTGGMKTKISLLYQMVKSTGATGYILNVKKRGVLQKLLSGKRVRCTVVSR